MNHDQLQFDLKQAISLKLLKSDTAALILSFCYRAFKQDQRVTWPYADLQDRLETDLESLREQHPQLYPRSAQAYLKQWCDEEHQFLRTYTRGSDQPLVELTADTERVLGWIESLQARTFIGTESRFIYIFDLLDEIVRRSTEDVTIRLAQLEAQKAELQREIDLIQQTGEVVRFSPTKLKERFLLADEVARQLLRDFAAVEQNFRGIARSAQEAQLQPDARKGAIVGYVLDADAALKTSDEGRSFYAFWEFLLSPTKQEELQALLDSVYQLEELAPLTQNHRVLRRIAKSLLHAGEKIVQSNHRLAEQLRRMLDERTVAESRRVRTLIAEIKSAALPLAAHTSAELEQIMIELEGPPEVELVMEKGWWEPPEVLSLQQQPIEQAQPELHIDTLRSLYSQFYVDEGRLHQHIERLLETRLEVTLGEVIAHYPVEQGLAEIISYVAIATRDERHTINASQTEQVVIMPATASSEAKMLSMPQIVFRSSYA